MQRRTEITIETERLLVISRRGERNILWCDPCARNVPMLTVQEVSATFSLEDAEQFHFAVTPEGRLLICSNSLGLESARRRAHDERSDINSTF